MTGTDGQLDQIDLGAIAREMVRRYQRDDVSGLAAELAYRFFPAIFPFSIFLAALSGFVAGLLPDADPTITNRGGRE